MSLAERWTHLLAELDSKGRRRFILPPRGIDFSSNDYLAYASRTGEPVHTPHASRSATAARLLRGHHPIWDQVETTLADWHQAPAALMFSSGYSANEGLLSTVVQPGDWVASDALNHASIIDGLRLSKAARFVYRHADLDHLEEGLRQASAGREPAQQLFVVTESLFGMDGDIAPLAQIVDITQRYEAHLIVDEAHATGCYGQTGSGLVDPLGLRSRVLATVHTGGKALGVAGAYVCGSEMLRELLINRCRHFMFSTALPPAVGFWWLEAIERAQQDSGGRASLHHNAAHFRSLLHRTGLQPVGTEYIVPVVVGSDVRTVRLADRLQEKGWDIRAIRPPTVPDGSARIRVSIHADHSPELLIQVAGDIAAGMTSIGHE